ncbi:MAG: N-acetylmuramoyl-L-alanine amidase [Anaerolineae bacterium]
MSSHRIVFSIPTVEEQLATLGLSPAEIEAAIPLIEAEYGPIEDLTPGSYSIELPDAEAPTPLPAIVNQDVITAIYAVARASGQDGWAMLKRADLTHLVRQRQDLYEGPPFDQLTGLSLSERSKLAEELGLESQAERVPAPTITWAGPTDNYSRGRAGHSIDFIVIHYTASRSLSSTIAWFKNPQARVSAHYNVGRDGQIWQIVRDQDTAWHAGLARRRGLSDEQNRMRMLRDDKVRANRRGIGIEIVNWGLLRRTAEGVFTWPDNWTTPFLGQVVEAGGEVWEAYTDDQYEAVIALVAYLCQRYNVPLVYPPLGPGTYEPSYPVLAGFQGILGHEAIDDTKIDPGAHFDWDRLMRGLQAIL